MKLHIIPHTSRTGEKHWEYCFEMAPVNGKRKRARQSGFKTKKEAEAAGNKAMALYYKTGSTVQCKDIVFQEFLKIWLEEGCSIDLKETTVRSYEKKVKNNISPKLGRYLLRSIRREDLQAFIIDLFNEGYSLNTLSVIIAILSKCMSYAVDNEYLAVSPAIGLKIPKNKTPDTETRKGSRVIVTEETMNKIFERFPEGSSSHIPLRIAYECGMRLGEVFGLVWEDIDFENKVINVNRQIQWKEDKKKSTKDKLTGNGKKEDGDGYWYFSNPKYNSFRPVEISDGLAALLKREKDKQESMQVGYGEYYVRYCSRYPLQFKLMANEKGVPDNPVTENGDGTEVNFVCRRECGSYINPRTLQHTTRVIHKDISREFNFHSLRHTHTTRLSESGMDVKYISERLGHKNSAVTLNVYTHVSDEKRRECAGRLNELYGK